MLPKKNHYQVLNIPFSATEDDIKKAFRKLALQYHPDANNDSYSTEKFIEIEAAYSVLSDSKKKAEYDYAFFAKNARYSLRFPASTPADILVATENLSNKIQHTDTARINRDLLSFEIENILSEHNLTVLHKANDTVTNRKILTHIIAAARPLLFSEITALIEKIKSITGNDSIAEKELRQFIQEAKQYDYWNRYKIYVAIAAAILFCILVFFPLITNSCNKKEPSLLTAL